jgi:XTP/dITP diphosphohydrolase
MGRKLEGKVVIATHNPGKLKEMRELLAPHGIETIAAGDLGLKEPDETGTSFSENAKIKAEAATKASGLPALADDSGLAVDALGGQPGIHSARWAGEKKDFAQAMRMVEEKLAARDVFNRRAAFIAVLCIAWPDGEIATFEGRVDGEIIWPPRGNQGFGYDPIFLPDGFNRTFGEMSSDEKHGLPPRGRGLSHRARAFVKLAESSLA